VYVRFFIFIFLFYFLYSSGASGKSSEEVSKKRKRKSVGFDVAAVLKVSNEFFGFIEKQKLCDIIDLCPLNKRLYALLCSSILVNFMLKNLQFNRNSLM